MKYQIKGATRLKEWKSQYGTEMVNYTLALEGVEGTVELAQKVTTKAPQAGDEIEGDVTEQTYNGQTYKKIKKTFNQGGTFTKSPKFDGEGMKMGNALNNAVIIVEKGLDVNEVIEVAKKLYEADLTNKNNDREVYSDYKMDKAREEAKEFADALNDGDTDPNNEIEVPF